MLDAFGSCANVGLVPSFPLTELYHVVAITVVENFETLHGEKLEMGALVHFHDSLRAGRFFVEYIYLYIYICIVYIHTDIYTHIYIYIYIHARIL